VSIAKLAAKVSDFYGDAGDSAVKSNLFSILALLQAVKRLSKLSSSSKVVMLCGHVVVKDGLKDVSIAKLAAKVSDFYGDAGDSAVKSNAISTDWIHHMTAKHHPCITVEVRHLGCEFCNRHVF
jgi:hypothetical protein